MTIDRRTLLTGALAAAMPAAAGALELPDSWRPQVVPMPARYRPGVILVYPDRFSLFWTLPDGNAIRYAVRVGRGDLYEPGQYFIGAKKEWPAWKPTPGMVEREPQKWAKYEKDGMPGGPNNPLGARALYLFQPGRGDTFLRIHGTNDPGSIARAVSNGCVGLMNDHIAHLYDLVPLNAEVYLYPKATAEAQASAG
ncbi:MAG: L,D-transpeptidase [Rhodobacter sp.]|nr:L,D-transpeptidase [Rhodobacter sp.]